MRRVGLCIRLGVWLRNKRCVWDDIMINMCSNTVGKKLALVMGLVFGRRIV